MGDQVWIYVGGSVMALSGLAFLFCLWHRQWSWAGLVVGLAHLGIVWLNAAAPFRGFFDADYFGYQFGFFRADPGLGVTLLAGSLVIAAMSSACLAARNGRGHSMLIVTGTSILFAWNLLLPMLYDLLSDPSGIEIQLGEFLTIPAFITLPLLLLVFVGPFVYGIRWSWHRALASDGTAEPTGHPSSQPTGTGSRSVPVPRPSR